MKRIFLCIFFLVLICCSCKKNVEVSFEQLEGTLAYAVNTSTNKVEEVLIDYKLSNEQDLFMLYTSYQNTFPLGYSSPANPNIGLLDSEIKNKIVFYTVDNYILLSDLSLFHEVLSQTGRSLGYAGIHIILNENQLI